MSKTDDLKTLLERLKGEVGRDALPDLSASISPGAGFESVYGGTPAQVSPRRPVPGTDARTPGSPARLSGSERFSAPPRPEIFRPGKAPAAANLAWSENKETMLFGMLASLLTLLGGIAASLVWLVLIGAAFFVLFGAITAAVLFGYAGSFRGAAGGGDYAEISARLDQLSRKVDGLVLRSGSGQGSDPGAFRGGSRDLERKVEELRLLVRSLSKAVEEQNK